MERKEMMARADKVYKDLQGIGIQPTKTNMAILMETLTLLENVYKYLGAEEAEAAKATEAEE